MKDVFNLQTLFPSYNESYLREYNYMGDQIILSIFTIFFCIVGVVGNGAVIWILSCFNKTKPFAIYILNLTLANFGCLLFLLPLHACFNPPTFHDFCIFDGIAEVLFLSMCIFLLPYTSAHLLLTVISIDRWVWVLFPNWYRRHRSPVLSAVVCVFIWALSLAVSGMPLFLLFEVIPVDYALGFLLGYIGSILICLLLVAVSFLTLLIKACFQSPLCHWGKLVKVVLLILFSFLLFTILTYASIVTFLVANVSFWTSLKYSVNPVIYFLVGRQNRGQFQERMKAILQGVFREERDPRMELQPSTQRSL